VEANVSRLDEFFFAPASAINLGICRFLFFAGLLCSRIPGRPHAWGKVPPHFYHPIGLFELLNLPVLRGKTLTKVEVVWCALLVMAAVGFRTRIATLLALLIGLYTLGLPNNFGKVGHGDQITILVMLILALSRCGEGFSIDRLFARKRGQPLPEPSPHFGWPIRMVWVLLASIFCSAGIAKLRASGLAWVTSNNLQILLIQARYGLNPAPTEWGLWLARWPLLCNVLAGGCVALELLFPLALLHRRLRMVIVPATLLMQIGIGLLMGIWFMPFLRAYLFWLPWERIVAVAAKRRGEFSIPLVAIPRRLPASP
jgi:hypothetical protein